jgi:hypothetical protein
LNISLFSIIRNIAQNKVKNLKVGRPSLKITEKKQERISLERIFLFFPKSQHCNLVRYETWNSEHIANEGVEERAYRKLKKASLREI